MDLPILDPTLATRNAPPKEAKGTAWLASKDRRAEVEAKEQKAMQEALARDRRICRVPDCEYMPKKPRVEPAHFLEHRGMGGNPEGDRTRRDLILTLCFIHHQQLDMNDLQIEPLTPRNADGPCEYRRPGESGQFEAFAAESTRLESEERNPA